MMQDNEKDKLIKEILKKDNHISEKANEIFANIKYTKASVKKTNNWFKGLLAIAATVVIAVVATRVVYNDNLEKKTTIAKDNLNTTILSNGENEEIKKGISFTSQDGQQTFTIDVEEGDYIQAAGWAGASNNVYYIKDGELYHLSLIDGTITKLITGVEKISMEAGNQIVVELKEDYTIHKEDSYIELKNKKGISFTSQDGQQTFTIDVEEGDYIQAAGWAGASNNVYYIKDGELYHLSLIDGTITKLITGVEKISMEAGNQIVVELKKDYTIHKEDNYIELKNEK